jgi:hypothetical protein
MRLSFTASFTCVPTALGDSCALNPSVDVDPDDEDDDVMEGTDAADDEKDAQEVRLVHNEGPSNVR